MHQFPLFQWLWCRFHYSFICPAEKPTLRGFQQESGHILFGISRLLRSSCPLMIPEVICNAMTGHRNPASLHWIKSRMRLSPSSPAAAPCCSLRVSCEQSDIWHQRFLQTTMASENTPVWGIIGIPTHLIWNNTKQVEIQQVRSSYIEAFSKTTFQTHLLGW